MPEAQVAGSSSQTSGQANCRGEHPSKGARLGLELSESWRKEVRMPRYEYRVVNGFTSIPERDEPMIAELVANGWEPFSFTNIFTQDFAGESAPEADIVGYFRRPIDDAAGRTADTRG